jgi:tetratricopeptide (TPR) repeat protein
MRNTKKHYFRSGWLAVLALALISAAPAREAEDLVRQGNAAYVEGDFAEAAGLYEKAEEATTDPGLVAFNKAVALQANGKWEEAENHYWLCLGDVGAVIQGLLQKDPNKDLPKPLCTRAGPRLARVLYNLGTCLLQRSQGTNPEWLEQAVVLLDHCVRLNPGDAGLKADARHNLALARELFRLNPKPPKSDKSGDSDKPQDPPTPDQKDKPGSNEGNSGQDNDQSPSGSQRTGQEPDANDNPLATDERTPGKGNLGTLPDTDELMSMSPEDAAAYLRQAMQRILGERRDYQQQSSKNTSRDVLDW